MTLEIKEIEGKFRLTNSSWKNGKPIYSEWFRMFDNRDDITEKIKEEFKKEIEKNIIKLS